MTASLAIWTDSTTSGNPSADVHVNFWKLKPNLCLLDMGFMTDNVNGKLTFNIFVPFKVNSSDVVDLGRILDGKNVLPIVFNAPYSPQDNYPNVKAFGVVDDSSQKKFICRTDIISSLKLTDVKEGEELVGTTVSVELNGLHSAHPCIKEYPKQYFRIRVVVRGDAVKSIVTTYKQADWWVLSSSVDIDVVDFRINEARNLPEVIRDALHANRHIQQEIDRIYYFLIVDARAEFSMANNNFSRCRVLEDIGWEEYLKGAACDQEANDFIKKRALIFHWKEVYARDDGPRQSFEDYNALVKIKHVSGSFLRTISFVLFVIFLGACGSIAATIFAIRFGLGAPEPPQVIGEACGKSASERLMSDLGVLIARDCRRTGEALGSSPKREQSQQEGTPSDKAANESVER